MQEANFRKDHRSASDGLDTEEFIKFYELISNTRSLNDDFALLTHGKEVLTMPEFRRFLRDTQKFEVSEVNELSEELLAKYEPLEALNRWDNRSGPSCRLLSCKGFRNLVLSPEFDVVRPQTKTVHQDMSRPLVNYFIATSHNT